jgi:SET domain-containing protein
MTASLNPSIEARHSVIHGSGVYAREPIPAHEPIIQYTGERITLAEAKTRERARQQRASHGEESCDYLYIIDEDTAIDGRHTANIARLINHACEANCRSDILDGEVWIVAARQIAPHEEITFDYGYTFRDGLHHPCCCGSPNCVGYIIAKHQRWRLRRWWTKEAERLAQTPGKIA